MDKNESGNEDRREKVIQKPARKLELLVAAEHNDSLNELVDLVERCRNITKERLEHSQSLFSDKKAIKELAFVADFAYITLKDALKVVFAIDYTQKQIVMIQKIVSRLVEKTNDLPAKADLEKLQKISSQMTHIDAVMSSIETKQSSPEANKKQKSDERYVC